MEIDFVSWIGLALRWAHMMLGIMWIGTSFYFIWMINSLKPPATKEDKQAGVTGEVWLVHGGGFFHSKKYTVAPEHMPDDLHWFKWEAYITWITGMLLLALIYYFQADLYLIDKAKMALRPFQAACIGLAFIGGGWVFYHELCKSPIGKNNALFGWIWFGALTAAAYALEHIFTDRGAFMHVGAIIGTAMAANVFAVIIPNQKKVVAALLAGEKPDPALGKMAGQRSLHNNYMTLPILLLMISAHYPMLYANGYGWLALSALGLSAWSVRKFFNLIDQGKKNNWYLVAGATGFLAVMLALSVKDTVTTTNSATLDDAFKIVQKHCIACHSAHPTFKGMSSAPAGVMFDTMEQMTHYAPRIIERAVKTNSMPFINETGMNNEDRQRLGEGLQSPQK